MGTAIQRCSAGVCLAWCLAGGAVPLQAQSATTVFGTTVVVPSGLRGEIYFLPPNTNKLPGFSSLDPVGAIYTSQLDISPRPFKSGFPGVTDRIEWFAIDYTGRFWIDEPGAYEFALTADDGAKFYIDGRLTIDNDGIHQPQRRLATVPLSGGIHRIRVSWFQGPRFVLALVLDVRPPGGQFHVFNTDEFKPPSDPAEWKYQSPKDLEGDAKPNEGEPAVSKARKAFAAGAAALADGKLGIAETNLHRAIETDPTYARAWSLLGAVCDQKALPDQARSAWTKALAADAHYVPAMVHLASLELTEGRDQNALQITTAAMASGARDNPLIWFYNAVANAHLGNREAAEKSAREAVRLDMANEAPRAESLLGMLLAEKGDTPGALEHLRRYLAMAPEAADAEEVRRQIAAITR